MEKLVIIDGNSLINRAFYAIPILTNSSGEYCNAVYGFCNILCKIILDEQPKYMAVCFDAGKHTFRHDLYKDYKGTRKGMPQELAEQLPSLKEVLKAIEISYFEMKEIEADDLVGTLSKKFDVQTIILSGDKDLLQLIDKTTEVHLTKKGVTDIQSLNEQTLKEYMNIKPYQVVELKALMGDSSDNIPGVLGVGEKTAKDLIEKYDNIDNLYAHIMEINGKLYEKLVDGKTSAYMSKTLATINTKVPLDVKLSDLEYQFPFSSKVMELFKHFEFNSLIKRENLFSLEIKQEITNKIVTEVIENESELDMLVEEINKTNLMAIYIEKSSVHIALSKFKEYKINVNSENQLLGLNLSFVLSKLKNVMEDKNIKKVCLSIKQILHIFDEFDIQVNNAIFDVSIANYLLSGSKKGSEDIQNYLMLQGYDKNSCASCLLKTYELYTENLKTENIFDLYYNLEMPLIYVLFDMEKTGFKLNKELLYKTSELYEEELQNLTEQIYELAGEKFNINSPKQLAQILFDKLLLPCSKKNNSTAVEVLEKLSNAHPIISKILQYRKISKLNGTYLLDFKKMLDKNDIIHTKFKQVLTSTGRLSSVEPNLQNIPIRDEEGKKLRKMFISRFDNGTITSADYSQIELRLLAHYTQDSKLLDAYNNDLDIHAKTASDIFNVPIEKVTSEERRKAKAVNFGIIYGISEYGLSQNLNISIKEAKAYITKYFETYPSVKEYMKKAVEKVRECGYAITMLGRKRKIDEINSSNYNERQFGERASMNMPLQGTASDLIKLAMIKVFNELQKQKLKSKLILQIHDELIVDTFPGEENTVEKILKDNMENVLKLNIKLVVDISNGKTWFEAK